MDAVEANAKLQPVRDQFLVRFYKWAREDMLRESREGFPFVRRITNPTAMLFLAFASPLREQDAAAFYSGIVKRSHRRAVELLQDFPSAEENVLLEQYRRHTLLARPVVPPRGPRTSRAKIRKALLRGLSPALGNPLELSANREMWMYQMPIGCWTLRTSIDTGGKRLLGYWHTIVAREPVLLHDQLSLLGWLGISQTEWTQAQEEDYAGIAECLVELHVHFKNALHRILEGLSHDLPEIEVRAWLELVTVKGHRKNGITIVLLNSPEARKTIGRKATWEIPTSIIPVHLRAIGSHFTLIQDPTFSRESDDPLAKELRYRHLRIEPAQR
jgi:hypothetical protein